MSRSGSATPNFNFQYRLAESMTPGKVPDVWTVKLRPGVTFHNGKPVTSADVIFSLQRILNPKKPGTGAASIGYVDLGKTKALDAHTVQIALTIPNVGFPDDIGQYFNGIVPVGYNPKSPDRDRPVQVPELHGRPAERVRARTRTTGTARRTSTR